MNEVKINIPEHGLGFTAIYGEYINGGFIAIPALGISADLSDCSDINYNSSRICKALEKTPICSAFSSGTIWSISSFIAKAIEVDYLMNVKGLTEDEL